MKDISKLFYQVAVEALEKVIDSSIRYMLHQKKIFQAFLQVPIRQQYNKIFYYFIIQLILYTYADLIKDKREAEN